MVSGGGVDKGNVRYRFATEMPARSSIRNLRRSQEDAPVRRGERPTAVEYARAAQVRALDDPVQTPAHVRRKDAIFEEFLLNRPRSVWIYDDQIGVEANVDHTLPGEARKPRGIAAHPFRDLRERVASRPGLGP